MTQDIGQNRQFHFEEEQRLTNWLLWTIIILSLLLTLSILVYQVVTGIQVGNNPAPNSVLIAIICIFYIPAISIMLYTKLIIQIDKDKIYYGFNIPTKDLNSINITDITSAEIIKYKFVGYGYRLSTKYGTVYNTSGNMGLLIQTKSGEKILLGTHKAQELSDTLTNLGVRHNL